MKTVVKIYSLTIYIKPCNNSNLDLLKFIKILIMSYHNFTTLPYDIVQIEHLYTKHFTIDLRKTSAIVAEPKQ